jgi:hypothetical protein
MNNILITNDREALRFCKDALTATIEDLGACVDILNFYLDEENENDLPGAPPCPSTVN